MQEEFEQTYIIPVGGNEYVKVFVDSSGDINIVNRWKSEISIPKGIPSYLMDSYREIQTCPEYNNEKELDEIIKYKIEKLQSTYTSSGMFEAKSDLKRAKKLATEHVEFKLLNTKYLETLWRISDCRGVKIDRPANLVLCSIASLKIFIYEKEKELLVKKMKNEFNSEPIEVLDERVMKIEDELNGTKHLKAYHISGWRHIEKTATTLPF